MTEAHTNTKVSEIETSLGVAIARLNDIADNLQTIGEVGIHEEASADDFKRLAALPMIYSAEDLRGIARTVDKAQTFLVRMQDGLEP